jgi:hypothetical protein
MSFEKKKIEKQKLLYDKFMPLSLDDVNAAYDQLDDDMSKLSWSISADTAKSFCTAMLNIIERTEYRYQMSGVICVYGAKFKANETTYTRNDIKVIQDIISNTVFKGIDQATDIKTALTSIEPMNIALSDTEIDMLILAELMQIKENEQNENLWSTDTLAWIEVSGKAKGYTLSETPKDGMQLPKTVSAE